MTRSNAQGVHIVHTLLFALFGASNQAAQPNVRAEQLCPARDVAPIWRVDVRNRSSPEHAPRLGAALMLEIDEHLSGASLLS
jgi:hypothetical protein